jgi:hypothetical protein
MRDKELLYRRALAFKVFFVTFYSLGFCKLILMKNYRRVNLPLKLLLTALFVGTVEPMTLAVGYIGWKTAPDQVNKA